MAVLSADVNISTVGPVVTAQFSSEGDTFFQGSVVYIDTGGGVQALPAAGDIALGISPKQQVATTAGDLVEVIIQGFVWVPIGTGIDATDEGDYAVLDLDAALSDNPADLYARGDITPAANDCIVGRILRATSTQMLLGIDAAGITGTLYAATAGWGG